MEMRMGFLGLGAEGYDCCLPKLTVPGRPQTQVESKATKDVMLMLMLMLKEDDPEERDVIHEDDVVMIAKQAQSYSTTLPELFFVYYHTLT
jgi:hypothetical protein